jgi:hypothetical protein
VAFIYYVCVSLVVFGSDGYGLFGFGWVGLGFM